MTNAERCRRYRQNRHERDMVRDMLRDMLPEIIQQVMEAFSTRNRHDMGVEMLAYSKKESKKEKRKEATIRGSRLPATWEPTSDQREFAIAWSLDPEVTANLFRNHWVTKTGRDATKTDWNRTWQNWCMNDKRAKKPLTNGHDISERSRPRGPAPSVEDLNRLRLEEAKRC